MRLLLGEDKAETKGVIRVVGRVAVTNRRATAPGAEVPAATATHAAKHTRSTSRIGLRSTTITAFPVLTPFPYITAHVVHSKLIRLLCGYVVCMRAAVITIPCYFVQIITSAVLVALALLTPSGCIFPFCLGGQAKFLTCKASFLCSRLSKSFSIPSGCLRNPFGIIIFSRFLQLCICSVCCF